MISLDNFKSGEYRQSINYKYFLPNPINEEWNWSNNEINKLIESASFEIGKLNALGTLVPNVDLFVQLIITKEAVVSSKIEGTQTHFDEALLKEKFIDPERRDDWQEVKNYINALNSAILELNNLPLSSRLILKTHKTLMDGVRGSFKSPGEYRKSQNWIGGISLADARFIPPHNEHIGELISDLEKFLHNDRLNLPIIVKSAIMHYQFETIHPFLDGNGRIGRLLIPLYLISEGVISKPLLYISGTFEQDRNLYYDNLTRVRTHNEIERWIKYFLVCLAQTANYTNDILMKVLELKEKDEILLKNNLGKRLKTGLLLYNFLLKQPLITAKEIQDELNITAKTAGELIKNYIDLGILEEFTGYSRNRHYAYRNYLNLFEN